MTDIPQDAPRSEDGQWWWDGSQWQPVGSGAGAATSSGTAASSSSAQTIDLTQYPTLYALYKAGSFDGWLQALGVDLTPPQDPNVA